jgi:hypothetical protein
MSGRRKARRWLPVALVGAFLCAGLGTSRGAAQAPGAAAMPEQRERIAASFVLGLGRLPSARELDEWARTPGTVAEMLGRHRAHLSASAEARDAVAAKASLDAFGPGAIPPTAGIADQRASYTDLVRAHVEWLAAHAQDYEAVMHRAYRLLLQRDAYDVEIDYWKRQPPLPFALLVGCIDDWARRNRPGLMATTGVAAVSVNSEYLSTVRLSPGVAGEARAAARLPPVIARARGRALPDRHVVAPGAANVVSVGGIHFAAAGGARLAAESRLPG